MTSFDDENFDHVFRYSFTDIIQHESLKRMLSKSVLVKQVLASDLGLSTENPDMGGGTLSQLAIRNSQKAVLCGTSTICGPTRVRMRFRKITLYSMNSRSFSGSGSTGETEAAGLRRPSAASLRYRELSTILERLREARNVHAIFQRLGMTSAAREQYEMVMYLE